MKNFKAASLLDPDPEVQEKTSLALYDAENPAEYLGDAEISAALRSSAGGESQSASAVLLLGYDSSPESIDLLREIRKEGGQQRTKLRPWTAVVPLSLVADISLSRLGDATARIELLQEIGHGSIETMRFLLDVLREIDDATVLHAIARALDDNRTVSGGVPSGAAPARRLADEAVDAFIKRLDLAVGFDPDPARRYSEDELAEVKQLIDREIPH
jgi:hypothetical protein